MPHEFRASIIVPLPEDPANMASDASALLAAWAAFVKARTDAHHEFSIVETRSKTPGAKRVRKPRVAVVRDAEEAA